MIQLKKGDTVGIVSPSAPISGFCPKRLARGVDMLEKMGYKVKLGKSVSKITGHTAGSAKERAGDIHAMFADSQVKAIIATIGGYNANDVLDLLDYEFIRKHNEKFFIGYSDITVLLMSLQKKSGVQTIMGPMILPQFGEYPAMQEFTSESFVNVVEKNSSKESYVVPISRKITEEFLMWDKDDVVSRKMQKNKGWTLIKKGKAKGKLVVGNLRTLLALAGTEYFPDWKDVIFFLEDDDEENAATLQRMLQQLKQIYFKKGIRGIVFGRFQQKSEINEEKLKAIIKEVFKSETFPIIANVDFGHTDPMLSIPLGKMVEMDAGKNLIKIIL